MSMALGMMNQTITIVATGGYDSWGEISGSTSRNAKARVQPATELDFDAQGETKRPKYVVYTDDLTITHDDRITYSGTSYTVMQIFEHTLGSGTVDHLKVLLI